MTRLNVVSASTARRSGPERAAIYRQRIITRRRRVFAARMPCQSSVAEDATFGPAAERDSRFPRDMLHASKIQTFVQARELLLKIIEWRTAGRKLPERLDRDDRRATSIANV